MVELSLLMLFFIGNAQWISASENSNLYRQSQGTQNSSAIRIKEEGGLTTYLTDAPTATTLIITSPVTFNSVPSPTADHVSKIYDEN